MFQAFQSLTKIQRRTFIAAFLGWTLDAFDFFLVTFVISRIATEFHKGVAEIVLGITVTLMLRPVGALIFGRLADRFGRRVPLMANILIYSFVELLTAFSPNYEAFIALRAVFGVAMGGEWGVGAALALETLPTQSRGLFSGILQQGYAFGYLLAAVAYALIFPHFGWRGMFIVGALPALLVVYIRSSVPESPVWLERKAKPVAESLGLWKAFLKQPMSYVGAVLMMTAFNFMSHGSQDLYPTFLQKQHGFSVDTVALIAIIANVGAIIGGTMFGAFSQNFGRRRTIVAAALVGIFVIPLWAFAPTAPLLALGGFLIQFFVQGAWGVVPVHLNELSPSEVRGTFPGFTYQIGNMIAAGAAQIEALFAQRFMLPGGGANYGEALAIIMLVVFLAVAFFTAIGRERHAVDFS
jgi:SHS family lactate transporter-like MFS transporter